MMKPPGPWPPDDPRRTPITLRSEYVENGVDDRALHRMVRDGVLAKPRRGAYVAGAAWRDLNEVGRHSVRARAVLRQARSHVVLSHFSGLREFDCPEWDLDLDEVHVTRLDLKAGRAEAGVRQHRGRIERGDVVMPNGAPVMHPTRLALEVTTIADVVHSLVVVSHFLRTGLTTRDALAARYRSMEHWPSSLTTDLTLRLADGRLESVGEVRFWHFCFERRLPAPVPQYEVRDSHGRVLHRLDFAWPDLGLWVEFDGRRKYETDLRPGERPGDVVVREKAREDLIRRLTGWRCIRITWRDLENPARLESMLREALFVGHVA